MSGVSVIAVLGSKGSPGATTAVLALGLGWPVPVLVVDADPGGGDMLPGWLGGRVGFDRGLLGFATSTRHLARATGRELAAELANHVLAFADVPGLVMLAGLASAGQGNAMDPPSWARLAVALAAEQAPGVGWADAVVDCGRISAATPWPLLAAAAVVLVTVRPTVRGCHHANQAITALEAGLGSLSRVVLVVCGPGPYPPREVSRALGLPVRVQLPADPRTAAVLSDSAHGGRWSTRTALARAAQDAAESLRAKLTGPAAVAAVGIAASGRGR